MQVKLSNGISSPRPMPGGTPQGGTLGTLEYNSETNHNTDFLTEEEKFKYIDDLSFLEVVSLLTQILSQYDATQQVSSDISTDDLFICGNQLQSQSHLRMIEKWTKENEGLLNTKKNNYMIFNFSNLLQFKTRLFLDGNLLEQVKKPRVS